MRHDYTILTRRTAAALALDVREAMADGWLCQGSLSVTALGTAESTGRPEILFAQAMIRHRIPREETHGTTV
jgi:hypothetical protein